MYRCANHRAGKLKEKMMKKICQVPPSLHCIGQGQSFVSVRTNQMHRQLGQPVFLRILKIVFMLRVGGAKPD